VLNAEVLRIGPYRIGFWSRENFEPPHVHVTREQFGAKYGLVPGVRLAQNRGFAAHELMEIRQIIKQHEQMLLRLGMNTFVKPEATPEPVGARVSDDLLTVDPADGRSISAPLEWFPRLFHGTPEERAKFEWSFEGIHWPDLNEDIPVEGLLRGEKSGESPASIQRWLDYRARGEKEPILTLPLPPDIAAELKKMGIPTE